MTYGYLQRILAYINVGFFPLHNKDKTSLKYEHITISKFQQCGVINPKKMFRIPYRLMSKIFIITNVNQECYAHGL